MQKYAVLLLLLAASCAPANKDIPSVIAAVETEPVGSMDDAADDPAVWINESDPAASLILGTDKKAGLYLYNLDGSVRQFLPVGALNNVDIRKTPAGWLAAATNRTDNTVTLFELMDGAGEVSGAFASPLDEPYGLCMGASGDETYVFVTYKTGDFIAFRLTSSVSAEEVGRLKLPSQLEGCVFDDETGALYIGEEDRGIWRAAFSENGLSEPRLVDERGGRSGLLDDIEGLALYKTGEKTGYLIASSQGNYSYAVYAREGENAFIGRFRIGAGETIDAAEETDGLDAVAAPLGENFPKGALIVQDGMNAPEGSAQNFKIVDWREIEKALALERAAH